MTRSTESDIRRIVREEIDAARAERQTPEHRQKVADRLISSLRAGAALVRTREAGGRA